MNEDVYISKMVAVSLALVTTLANAAPEVPLHCQLIGKAVAHAVVKRKKGVSIERVYKQVIRATPKT